MASKHYSAPTKRARIKELKEAENGSGGGGDSDAFGDLLGGADTGPFTNDSDNDSDDDSDDSSTSGSGSSNREDETDDEDSDSGQGAHGAPRNDIVPYDEGAAKLTRFLFELSGTLPATYRAKKVTANFCGICPPHGLPCTVAFEVDENGHILFRLSVGMERVRPPETLRVAVLLKVATAMHGLCGLQLHSSTTCDLCVCHNSDFSTVVKVIREMHTLLTNPTL
jgi:hypothetical protein